LDSPKKPRTLKESVASCDWEAFASWEEREGGAVEVTGSGAVVWLDCVSMEARVPDEAPGGKPRLQT